MIADRIHVELTVNGLPRGVDVAPGRTLLDMLRWELDLTGSKECCAEGECGACTVRLNGEPVNSCLVLAAEANGAEVVTIEGLGEEGRLSRLQDAFLECGAVQCGFCIPGMVMAADALLAENPDPSMAEVREGLSGNLCRCAGYTRICAAVLSVAGSAASTEGDPGHEAALEGGPGAGSADPGSAPDPGSGRFPPGSSRRREPRLDPGSAAPADSGNRRFALGSDSAPRPSYLRLDPGSARTAEQSNRRFDPSSRLRREP